MCIKTDRYIVAGSISGDADAIARVIEAECKDDAEDAFRTSVAEEYEIFPSDIYVDNVYVLTEDFVIGNTQSTKVEESDLRDAMLCLWEAFLESPERYPEIDDLRGDVGTAELRSLFADTDLCEACHRSWEVAHAMYSYGEVFDWDYVPQFLSECVSVENEALVVTDWQPFVQSLAQEEAA